MVRLEFREKRDALIERLKGQQDALVEQATPRILIGISIWFVTSVTVVQQLLWLTWAIFRAFIDWVWAGLSAPFVYLYFAADITIITLWHGREVYKKMTGSKS